MASTIINLADLIVQHINTTFAPDLLTPAVRAYVPEMSLPEMSTVRVTVIPQGRQSEVLTRTTVESELSVDIAVQQSLTGNEAAKSARADELMDLAERIEASLRIVFGNCCWSGSAFTFVDEHYRQSAVYTAVLTMTYKAAS